VHGIVQLGSNAGRAALSWRHIDWSDLGAFLPGALIGALLGSFVIVVLPPPFIYLTIALFTLILCWGPRLPRFATARRVSALAGAGFDILTR
jgi:uncharacterized membrane protein YfcA